MSKAIKCPYCKKEFFMRRRTNPQNNRYWGMIIPAICDVTGMIPDDVHEEMKLMFNGQDSRFKKGEKIGGTTTTLTTKQFINYCEQVEFWATAFLGVEFEKIQNVEANEKEHFPKE